MCVTFDDGSETSLQDFTTLPDPEKLSGMLLHLSWRKNHPTADCWVPVACKTTLRLLLAQVCFLRKSGTKNTSLFPSRVWKDKRAHAINDTNWIGEQSWVRSMRKALVECVPLMSARWARLYSGHALRIGGSNHMRRMGVDNDIHRRLSGWMTLVSAQGYMVLTPKEQFAYTVKLAESVLV